MKSTKVMLGIWVAALLLATAAPARAQSTVDACQAQLAAVLANLDAIDAAGGIGGNNSDRTDASLSSKLTGAGIKLDEGKYADALAKLEDFQDAVIAMRDAAKPKLSDPDATLLLDGAAAAIACILQLP
jgi:hypothetical protein